MLELEAALEVRSLAEPTICALVVACAGQRFLLLEVESSVQDDSRTRGWVRAPDGRLRTLQSTIYMSLRISELRAAQGSTAYG